MNSLMKYVDRISRCAILYRSNALAAHGLNGHHHAYILNICQNPGISQDRLAKMIYVNKSNVARQIAYLEQEGFVTRTPSPENRRQLEVYPTDKAREVYPHIQQVLRHWNHRLLEGFTAEEEALLLSMMGRIMARAVEEINSSSEPDKEVL